MTSQRIADLLDSAEREAAQGCGQSDVLFEARVQEAYAEILADAPPADRAAVEALLRARGFDPEMEPYRPAAGECSHTGLDIDCCPCGRH